MSMAKLIYMAQEKDLSGTHETISKYDAMAAVFEVTLVTFFITLLPKLIALGRPPVTLVECWEPLLSSALMALYTYSRARGLNIDVPEVEQDE